MSTSTSDFITNSIRGVGSAAMLIALSKTLLDEQRLKDAAVRLGYRVVVTEVGARNSFNEFDEKVIKAVVGAGLNGGIIAKQSNEIHALVHATEEAKKGILISVSRTSSLAMKVVIARDEHWLAVAMFGLSALHYMTNHERAGLGIMHI